MSHPLLMEDGGIVFQDSGPLVRIDACSRIVWTIDGIFHHSIERDSLGNLWVPYTPLRSKRAGFGAKFRDDAIAHVSPGGRLLSTVYLFDILVKNGLGGLFESHPYLDDPFHLNDIEPVLTSGPYWKAGDVFLSLRHLSLIMLYRPSTGKIIWWKQGPWRMQHDVNILDSQRISIFDNHARFSSDSRVDGHNNLLIYDFATTRLDDSWNTAFADNSIQTFTQGRGKVLPDGEVFVEDTENGRLLRMAKDGRLRWDYVAADQTMARLFLAWSRVLDITEDAKGIGAAQNRKCK
jgi:Arylsulfotransferase (ASST)